MEKRKVLLIAGGGVLVVGGYLLYRHYKGSAVQSGSAGGYSGLPVITSTYKDGVGSNGLPILYGSAGSSGSSSGAGGGGVGSNPPQGTSLGTGSGIVGPGNPGASAVPIGNSSLVTPQTSAGTLAGALTQQEEAVQQQIDLEDTEQNQFAQGVYASAIAQNQQGLIASSQPTTPISTTNPHTGSAVTVIPQAGSSVFSVVSTPPPPTNVEGQPIGQAPPLTTAQEEELLNQGGF